MKTKDRLKVDLHIHTSHSKDGGSSPQEVVKRAIYLGFDAIAVTDHDTASGSLEAERFARGSSLLVMPGQEVHSKDGEIIILGLRESLEPGMPALRTIMEAKRRGGFVIVPHPFDVMRKGLGKAIRPCLKHIDAVEVFNSRTIFSFFNNKAMAFADRHNMPMSVGSDSHFLEELGKSYMMVESRKDTKSILDAIRNGKAELIMKRQDRASKLKRGLLKIRTYF